MFFLCQIVKSVVTQKKPKGTLIYLNKNFREWHNAPCCWIEGHSCEEHGKDWWTHTWHWWVWISTKHGSGCVKDNNQTVMLPWTIEAHINFLSCSFTTFSSTLNYLGEYFKRKNAEAKSADKQTGESLLSNDSIIQTREGAWVLGNPPIW